MFFLTIFLDDRRIRIRTSYGTNGSGKPKNIGTNPTDPDPPHCIKPININSVFLFILRIVTLNLQSSIVRQKKGFQELKRTILKITPCISYRPEKLYRAKILWKSEANLPTKRHNSINWRSKINVWKAQDPQLDTTILKINQAISRMWKTLVPAYKFPQRTWWHPFFYQHIKSLKNLYKNMLLQFSKMHKMKNLPEKIKYKILYKTCGPGTVSCKTYGTVLVWRGYAAWSTRGVIPGL